VKALGLLFFITTQVLAQGLSPMSNLDHLFNSRKVYKQKKNICHIYAVKEVVEATCYSEFKRRLRISLEALTLSHLLARSMNRRRLPLGDTANLNLGRYYSGNPLKTARLVLNSGLTPTKKGDWEKELEVFFEDTTKDYKKMQAFKADKKSLERSANLSNLPGPVRKTALLKFEEHTLREMYNRHFKQMSALERMFSGQTLAKVEKEISEVQMQLLEADSEFHWRARRDLYQLVSPHLQTYSPAPSCLRKLEVKVSDFSHEEAIKILESRRPFVCGIDYVKGPDKQFVVGKHVVVVFGHRLTQQGVEYAVRDSAFGSKGIARGLSCHWILSFEKK
jgi:hypothetical protein